MVSIFSNEFKQAILTGFMSGETKAPLDKFAERIERWNSGKFDVNNIHLTNLIKAAIDYEFELKNKFECRVNYELRNDTRLWVFKR